MELIGFELGRVVALLTTEDWRSTSLPIAEAFKLIKERYRFVYSPNLALPWDDVQKNGWKFQLGSVKFNDITLPIQEFTLYNDGLVVNATNTDAAEAFLNDLFGWARETAGIRDLTNVGRRLYVSNVVVEFERPVNQLINGFQDFSRILDKLMQDTYKVELPMQLRTLAFHYDQLALPSWINVTHFSIDRRIGHKYDENRFFSEAPFRTGDHLRALEALESLISK